ncbi:MAG: hypothetical protein AAGJ11_17220 [Bacteroidota bacterium]
MLAPQIDRLDLARADPRGGADSSPRRNDRTGPGIQHPNRLGAWARRA